MNVLDGGIHCDVLFTGKLCQFIPLSLLFFCGFLKINFIFFLITLWIVKSKLSSLNRDVSTLQNMRWDGARDTTPQTWMMPKSKAMCLDSPSGPPQGLLSGPELTSADVLPWLPAQTQDSLLTPQNTSISDPSLWPLGLRKNWHRLISHPWTFLSGSTAKVQRAFMFWWQSPHLSPHFLVPPSIQKASHPPMFLPLEKS